MMTTQECTPPSARLSPPPQGETRRGFQPPDGALGVGCIPDGGMQGGPPREPPAPPDGETRDFSRITTFRLEPSKEHYALLRLRDAQAAQKMNRYSIQLFAERNGWRPPEDSTKDTLTKHGRMEKDDLSSSIYVACEKRVQNDWKRIGKRIWSGVQVPTYRKGCLPFDSGGRPENGGNCGVKIIRTKDAGYAALLHITAKDSEGDNWIEVPISRRTEIDERRAELAAQFADGAKHVLSGQINFARDKVLLRVSFKVRRVVPKAGERVATVSEFGDGRLLIRSEFESLDFSSRLYAVKQKKLHWDGISRRFSRRSSRSKGSARRHREKLDNHSFSRWASTEMHVWSRRIVEWAIKQHCGSIVIELTGGDWPAHDLIAKLKYKADEVGMKVTEASLEQRATDRAVKAAVAKRQRRAKKLGDAVRELNHQLGDQGNVDQS